MMKQLKSPLLVLLMLTMLSITAQKKNSNIKMDPEKSILKNAENSGNHELLLAAVHVSELETLLDGEAQFTVFAPSDVNFDSSTKARIIDLVKIKNKKEIQSILGYHIIAGKLTASKILRALCSGKGRTTFTTITGDILVATMKGLDIILTDKYGQQSIITKADANQCNGVIHVIDSVNHIAASKA
ncbi:fasciclin domain-containing protein [Cellulophaga sp. E16_2]|uniref:fasciclin domain-containing protein n=1 Tax=unclassified Cellulophaga TaxID=2634405 RepID=UPI0013FE43C3|nr:MULTISPECIES: fasciclin domain-containing protein [unclassified Cellulophaga]MBO0593023.1 fasciclin domain-containing protein [Cellulophaga sp. E16_2]